MGMPQAKFKSFSMPDRFFRQTSTFLMDFSRAEGAESAERKSGPCDATYCQIVTCACVKKAWRPFSAIFTPLREPVFPSFGPKDEEKTRQMGPRQWVFIDFVYQFPRTDPS
jgi:hypothetical protein